MAVQGSVVGSRRLAGALNVALAVTLLAAACSDNSGGSGGSDDPSPAPDRLGPTEVNVTDDLTYRYGEPQLAVNPKDPDNLVYAVLQIGTTYKCQDDKRPGCEIADTVFGPQPAGLINNEPGFSDVRVYVSHDRGKTWAGSADIPYPSDHPALVERGDPLLTAGP